MDLTSSPKRSKIVRERFTPSGMEATRQRTDALLFAAKVNRNLWEQIKRKDGVIGMLTLQLQEKDTMIMETLKELQKLDRELDLLKQESHQ